MPSLEAKVMELPPFEYVISSYTGNVGCMCGCLGKHYYATKHRRFSSRDRGYTVGDDEVSDLAVKRTYNKLSRLLKNGETILTNCAPSPKVNYMYYEKGNRCCCIYFKY